jgi:hypothetical protein
MAIAIALIPATALAASPTRLGAIDVPATSDGSSLVPFPTVLEGGGVYRIVVTGVGDIWPARNYTVDAAYCFSVPDFCPTTPAYNNTLQWLSFEDDVYQGFAGFPSSTPYNPQHKYQARATYARDTTLKFSTTDTSPADNTGSFRVEIFKLPVFRFYALSCVRGDKTKYRVLALPNGGCQSTRLIAEGPEKPEGALIEMQVRHRKRWESMHSTCGAGQPQDACRILVDANSPHRSRYRTILRFPNSDEVIASRAVTVFFLDTKNRASVPE